MTRYRAWLWRTVVAALVCFAAVHTWRYYRIHFPERNHPMIALLQDMQTYCVGRYQIDLPRGSRLIRAEDSAGRGAGTKFHVEHPLGNFQAQTLIQKRWLELKELKAEPGMEFTRSSERIDLPNGGVVFTFKHRDVHLDEWPDGTKGTHSFYDTEGYLWRNQTLYKFEGTNRKEDTVAAMEKLVSMDNTEMPVGQGFCAGRSFFPGPPTIGESINLAFRLPEEANTEIRIQIPWSDPIRPDYAMLNFRSLETTKLRSAKRDIGPLEGEEWGNMTVDTEGFEPLVAKIGYTWFHAGDGYDHLRPGIHIFIEGSVPAHSGIDPSSLERPLLSKDEFTALWDGIMETFRERPGAF